MLLAKVFALVALTCPLCSASGSVDGTGADVCALQQEETSLMQVKKTVKLGKERPVSTPKDSVRADGRCGGSFGGAGCDPYSESPCCSVGGWCGISSLHCSGHDYRRDLAPGAFLAHVEREWSESCSGETPQGYMLIKNICPHCRLGKLVLAQSDTENAEAGNGNADKCYMEVKGVPYAPSSVWRIDLMELETPKTPKIYWPLTTYGYEQFTGSNVMPRSEATHWAQLMYSMKPAVKHALDIGANVGDTALPISLFATGQTVAFEMLPKNFEVLSFLANLNPALGIAPKNVAVGREDGNIEYSEDSGNGRSFLSFLQVESVPVVEPISFLEKTYGKGFTDDIGFIKIDTR